MTYSYNIFLILLVLTVSFFSDPLSIHDNEIDVNSTGSKFRQQKGLNLEGDEGDDHLGPHKPFFQPIEGESGMSSFLVATLV